MKLSMRWICPFSFHLILSLSLSLPPAPFFLRFSHNILSPSSHSCLIYCLTTSVPSPCFFLQVLILRPYFHPLFHVLNNIFMTFTLFRTLPWFCKWKPSVCCNLDPFQNLESQLECKYISEEPLLSFPHSLPPLKSLLGSCFQLSV